MIVKVCGITTAEDAQIAVEAGAAALGFNFYPKSPRHITPQAARRIGLEVPATVLKVGIFVNESAAAIAAAVVEAGLDIAQVIGQSPGAAVRYWMVHRVEADFTADQLEDPHAEAFLLDTPSDSLYGGTGQAFDWMRADIPGRRIILAGGLGPDNVRAAIRACRPWGVDACSRLEREPGRKDPEKVKAFVEAALNV
jgi:phosphoribosylanthranilate isomerase